MDKSKAKILLAGLATIIIIVVVVITQLGPSKPAGQTTNAPNASPSSSETAYSGLDALYNRGLSDTQVEDIKFAFYRFTNQAGRPANTIEFKNIYHRVNRDVGVNTLVFDAKIDDKPIYQSTVTLIDIDSIQLTLSQNGKQVFDSGVVKVESDH